VAKRASCSSSRCAVCVYARKRGVRDAFHRAYTNATQQALLEAHEYAFDYFGGVFGTLRYDNMTSVVKKILRGRQRIETDRIPLSGRNRHRLSFALGLSERILQSGQRE
jgi:transposase